MGCPETFEVSLDFERDTIQDQWPHDSSIHNVGKKRIIFMDEGRSRNQDAG